MTRLTVVALSTLAFAFAMARGAAAQNAGPIQIEAGRAEERRTAERLLDSNRLEVERLLDMRLRHDLGLIEQIDESVLRSDVAPTTAIMDRMRRELKDEVATAQVMRQRYEQMREAVERSRRQADAAAAQAAEQAEAGEAGGPLTAWNTSELLQSAQPIEPGAAPPGGRAANPGVGGAGPRRASAGGDAGTREGGREAGSNERAIPPVVLGELALDPLQAHIHGSDDHQRVAQALFKAGQALMDRADELRARGQDPLAEQLAARGKQRLEFAIKELEPLLAEKEPAFVSLFYLGRCRELLFRHAERYEGLSLTDSPREYQQREQKVREPFLQIATRDVEHTGPADSVDVLGSWGQAATTAMEHFRWMNLNGHYDVHDKIRELSWPGRQQL